MVGIKFFLYCSLVFGFVSAHAIGFSKGKDFSSVEVSGEIFITCQDPTQGLSTALFQCSGNYLLPVEFDYFAGPKGFAATHVELTVTKEDNSVRSKTLDYDSATGLSKSRFNLWVNTLFQKPLLGHGTNRAEYKIYNQSQIVNTGKFNTVVNHIGEKFCEKQSYISSNAQDCISGQRLCDRYFEQQNYCM